MSVTDPFVDDLYAFNMPIHLVLDGAIVFDIPSRLKSYGLVGRPLFREIAHRATVLAGPWLISVGLEYKPLECAVAAAQSVGKGVFWLGARSDEDLFQHLRRLNAARMPDGRILYFRHYDSDVLAAIAPMLDAEQAARLFGAAKVIGFVGGCGDRATVEKPTGLPEAASGPISFESWQIEALNERQRVLSRKKIAKMLREELPSQTYQLDGQKLDASVLAYETEATEIGLTSESAQAKWAYLRTISGSSAPDVAKYLVNSSHRYQSANDAIEDRFQEVVKKYARR